MRANLSASERNSILKGEYVYSTTRSCAGGFFEDDLSRSANGSFNTAFLQGILNFNGDGTGNINYTILQIDSTMTSAGQYPVTQGSGSGTLVYDVYEDKTFTIELFFPGPPSLEGIKYYGTIGHGNQLLLISDTEPNIEITTLENGNTRERICGRSNTSMRKKLIE